MKNTNENEEYNIKEKKIIIYLIILSLVLMYFSLFFIHYITSRGTIKNTQSITITYPDNNNIENNDAENSYPENVIENTSSEANNEEDGNNDVNNNGNITDEEENIADNNGNITDDEENIVDNNDRFRVLQGTQEWSKIKELDIFKNTYYNDKAIIAPGVYGNYNFTVENYGDVPMEYNIAFNEENTHNINMVYKLKLNGSYIAGNENNWVKYEDLAQEKLILNALVNDIFTIEWKWEDNYNDTQIGEEQGANYKLEIKVNAVAVDN